MTILLSCLFVGLLFTYGCSALQYPIGDIRNCPTDQVGNTDTPALQMNALPGLGFDNLRNLDTGRVYATNFSECQISRDGQYILPNNIYLVPVLNSKVDFSADVFDHFDYWKSSTATSINLEAKFSGDFSVSGKFSTDYLSTKSKMVNSKSSSVRVGLRHHLYSVHVDPASQLHPSFKTRVLDIAASIQNNNTELAHYLTDLLIRDYGTHVVTSIEVGASMHQTTFVAKTFSQATETSEVDVSTSASANFFSAFSISTNFQFSKANINTQGFSNFTTHSHTSTHGGPPFKLGGNFSYVDWENKILDHLVAIDRRGQPLHTAISPSNLPELPDVLLLETIEYIYKSISKYYSINTHYGCTDPDSPNFSFQANVNDGSCQMTRQNHSFGGIYQTCHNGQQSYDVCEKLSVAQTNPLSGGYSCPDGFTSVLLHTDTVTVTNTHNDCTWHCGFLGFNCYKDCKKKTIINYATYHAYWCAYPPDKEVPSNSGYLFGGVYTSKQQNPITGARKCPAFFYPLHFGQDLEVCVSNDQEGLAFSIPFGGFQSCQSGNPLASSPSQFKRGIYRHACPCQYSQFMATVDQGCVINYCSEVEAFRKQLPHPPHLPPYKVKADLTVNISDTLAITGPYGNLWIRKSNGEWMEYKQGQYSNGVDYLKSLNTESINPITGRIESRSASKGELAGVIIGTIIATLSTVVFIVLVAIGVKKYRVRRKKKQQLAQKYSAIEETYESTTDSPPSPSTNENHLVLRVH